MRDVENAGDNVESKKVRRDIEFMQEMSPSSANKSNEEKEII